MKKKIEERVPAIAEVEKRRLELEDEVIDKAVEIKNLQDQLRDTIKKHSKMTVLLQTAEKRVRDMEAGSKSSKERLTSLRKLNTQYE